MVWVVEVEDMPKSVLPSGGCPADDRAYLEWRDNFLARAAETDVVRRWHDAFDRPAKLDGWRFDRHLFAALGALPLLGDQALPTYSHRTRFLGVQLKTRRRYVLREAHRFLEKATHDASA